MRALAPHEVGDDTVPPMIEWSDVEILHQRLVKKSGSFVGVEERRGKVVKEIKWLTWLVRCYKEGLRARRDRGLTGHVKEKGASQVKLIGSGSADKKKAVEGGKEGKMLA